MGTPFLSEIRVVSFNFAPKGWALCNGQLLPINQNQALFSLLGTTYGGNGQTTFALPNLQGRTPNHVGSGFTLGEAGGETAHTLNISELPAHTHTPLGNQTNPASSSSAGGKPLGLCSERLCRQFKRVRYESGVRYADRRQSTAPKHVALPGAQLHHCPSGDLPLAKLKEKEQPCQTSL